MSDIIRTCAGCRRRAPQRELQRYTLQSGRVTPDTTGRARGRGVYTCRTRACVVAAHASGGFSRGLKANVIVDTTLEELFGPG